MARSGRSCVSVILSIIWSPRRICLEVLRLANNYLDPDGVFVFDLNTHLQVQGDPGRYH